MGIGKDGKPKANYQPGMDIFAGVTVLGEGVRGSCTKQLIGQLRPRGPNPQTYETGIKEIWRVKPEKHQPGRVVHGSMFPDFFDQINGMWLYDMKDNLISFGYVTSLSSEDPTNDPHRAAQEFKRDSPFMRDLLEGAELVRYGAKCIPTGGLLRDAEALRERRDARRRLRAHAQHHEARRHPHGDQVGHARGGDPRRRPQAARLQLEDPRRLCRALQAELGLRRAPRRPELHGLERDRAALRHARQHPA